MGYESPRAPGRGEEDSRCYDDGSDIVRSRLSGSSGHVGGRQDDRGEVCQALETSEQTFHRWRNQYGGMKAEEAKRLKKLEEENKRLKGLLAEAELDKAILREVKGNGPVLHAAGRRFTKSSGRWAFRNVGRAGRWSNHEPRSVIGR